MAKKQTLAASMQAKSGRLYAVINIREDGKSKAVWRAMGLPDSVGKATANKAFRETVARFEDEYNERLLRGDRPDADIPIYTFLCAHLTRMEKTLQESTVRSYDTLVHGRIKQHFTARPSITVGNLRPKDIEEFYEFLYSVGCGENTVLHYHTLMHSAFKQAVKRERIDVNPFDRIDRPKKQKYTADCYSKEELTLLLDVTRDETIYPAIMLAGGLGVRRSEALGIRWSRINWEEGTVLIDTKVIDSKDASGKGIAKAIEEMKNKSSRRTLAIPTPVMTMLKEQKEKQEMYRQLFRGSYDRTFDDYVCTDQLGRLIKPSYVTSRYDRILKRYGLRKIRYHDLRHTFASILIAEEVPLINVSKFLGHSGIGTTANIYAHLDKEGKQISADVIGNVLTGK